MKWATVLNGHSPAVKAKSPDSAFEYDIARKAELALAR